MQPPDHQSLEFQADPALQQAMDRLHQVTVVGRWLVVGVLWVSVGALSLWGLRYPISLIEEHFTWAAVRVGLAYNPVPAVGLGLCVGMTVSVLVWQSRNILVGLPSRERQRLAKQAVRIREQGSSHPLWKWVWKKE